MLMSWFLFFVLLCLVFCGAEEANDQKKALKEQCADLKDKLGSMEEDSRLASVAKVQVESYRQRLEKFESEINEERKKADRVRHNTAYSSLESSEIDFS